MIHETLMILQVATHHLKQIHVYVVHHLNHIQNVIHIQDIMDTILTLEEEEEETAIAAAIIVVTVGDINMEVAVVMLIQVVVVDLIHRDNLMEDIRWDILHIEHMVDVGEEDIHHHKHKCQFQHNI